MLDAPAQLVAPAALVVAAIPGAGELLTLFVWFAAVAVAGVCGFYLALRVRKWTQREEPVGSFTLQDLREPAGPRSDHRAGIRRYACSAAERAAQLLRMLRIRRRMKTLRRLKATRHRPINHLRPSNSRALVTLERLTTRRSGGGPRPRPRCGTKLCATDGRGCTPARVRRCTRRCAPRRAGLLRGIAVRRKNRPQGQTGPLAL